MQLVLLCDGRTLSKRIGSATPHAAWTISRELVRTWRASRSPLSWSAWISNRPVLIAAARRSSHSRLARCRFHLLSQRGRTSLELISPNAELPFANLFEAIAPGTRASPLGNSAGAGKNSLTLGGPSNDDELGTARHYPITWDRSAARRRLSERRSHPTAKLRIRKWTTRRVFRWIAHRCRWRTR